MILEEKAPLDPLENKVNPSRDPLDLLVTRVILDLQDHTEDQRVPLER